MVRKNKPIILHSISSLKIGGAENVLCSLALSLKNDFKQHVCYIHGGPFLDVLKKNNISTTQIKGIVSKYDPLAFYRIFKLVKKIKPNIIHSSLWLSNIMCCVVGKILNIPTIAALHNNLEQDGSFRNFISKLVLPLAGYIVPVSYEVGQGFECRFPDYPKDKIVVIRNGVDWKGFLDGAEKEKKTREDLGFGKDDFIIGSVGRFESVKNYQLLIRVCHRLFLEYPRAHLVIVGSGSQEKYLKALATKLGIKNRVTFITNQSARGFYNLFDCYVQTSSQEGVSIALLEAMSFGLPCIITNLKQLHDVILQNKNGIIVPAENEGCLASAVGGVMDDVTMKMFIGENARCTIKNKFDIFYMTGKYKEVYGNIYK